MKPQQTYEFRVAAYNSAGQSDWSENSVPILVLKTASRPIISLGMLAKDVIAFAGKPAKILVPYAASPKPEVVWKKNSILINESDNNVMIETNDFLTILNYKKCEQTDSGTYTIRVSFNKKNF